MVYHLFYLVGIFYLFREIIDLLHPIQYANKMSILYKIDFKKKDFIIEQVTPEEKSAIWYAALSLIYVMWIFIGLFTSEWIIFLAFLIFSFFIYSPIVKLIRTKLGIGKAYITTHIIATIIDICLILFALINHYHLHIDLFKLFLN